MATKKLIEVALPLEKINEESAREKSIRHGHPSALHLWWARRPLTTARAVLWSSLVDDPSSHPELYPTEEQQDKERYRLFKILEDLVSWDNSNNKSVLDAAKTEIMKSTNNIPPKLLDPFAGGGAIPLESQRLGLESYANDLNPVAVLINTAMIDIPSRFENTKPVNPDYQRQLAGESTGIRAISEDVLYYGEWMKKMAYERIGHLYPKVSIPKKLGGGEATVIAWIWSRAVKCPNPSCDHTIPLMGSLVLSKKKGNEAWIKILDNADCQFEVKSGAYDKRIENGTKEGKKAVFRCPYCKAGIVNGDYIDDEAEHGRMTQIPVAIVAKGERGRIYLSANNMEMSSIKNEIDSYYESHGIDDLVPHAKCRGTFASNALGRRYGFHEFKDYFTKRQLVSLATFSNLVEEAQVIAENDAIKAGYKNDHIGLSEGGTGARAYGEAIGVYLSFIVDKMADLCNSLNRWEPIAQCPRQLFGRQAIPIVWDFAESNPFGTSSGSWDIHLKNFINCVTSDSFCFQRSKRGYANQFDAQSDFGLRNIMVSTDPPYYDNIDYSDLSDFFYVWMRQSLKNTYPNLFSTMLTPKAEELIATPYRHEGDVEKARSFFENGMLQACQQIYKYSNNDIPVTIYYAYKQSETDDSSEAKASSGWEAMLSAIIQAGFSITGTWPMNTECSSRNVSQGTNALASSIILVCRKRADNAIVCTRREFLKELKRELRPALRKLQKSNIAPVDLAQSAIGPGMGAYSKYAQVLEANGTPMTVRSALQIINQELDLYFNEQDSELDAESRFCIDLYSQSAFNEISFGDANILATAKNTSVASLASHGTLFAQKGKVHLVERSELPKRISENEGSIWLLCQQLTYKMEKEGIEGCAQAIADMYGSNSERAKDLAYRLFTIAERKKWAQEAYAYNALVVSWPEIQSRAAEMKAATPEQLTMDVFL